MTVKEQIIREIERTPDDDQLLQKVLDFWRLIQSENQVDKGGDEQLEKVYQIKVEQGSFLDATREFVGCLDSSGPPDLSSNKQYLAGLGGK
jgi:hypothetical protein